jgi:hypothetical protein
LRAAGADERVFEVEQLAVCAESFPEHTFKVFGLSLDVSTRAAAVCSGSWGGAPLPVIACLGLPGLPGDDASAPTPPERYGPWEPCGPDHLVSVEIPTLFALWVSGKKT